MSGKDSSRLQVPSSLDPFAFPDNGTQECHLHCRASWGFSVYSELVFQSPSDSLPVLSNSSFPFPFFRLQALPLDEGNVFSLPISLVEILNGWYCNKQCFIMLSWCQQRDHCSWEKPKHAVEGWVTELWPQSGDHKGAGLHWENAWASMGTQECFRKEFMISINRHVCFMNKSECIHVPKMFANLWIKCTLQIVFRASPKMVCHFSGRKCWVWTFSGRCSFLRDYVLII